METKYPSVSMKRGRSDGDYYQEEREENYCLVGNNTEKIEIFLCCVIKNNYTFSKFPPLYI